MPRAERNLSHNSNQGSALIRRSNFALRSVFQFAHRSRSLYTLNLCYIDVANGQFAAGALRLSGFYRQPLTLCSLSVLLLRMSDTDHVPDPEKPEWSAAWAATQVLRRHLRPKFDRRLPLFLAKSDPGAAAADQRVHQQRTAG